MKVIERNYGEFENKNKNEKLRILEKNLSKKSGFCYCHINGLERDASGESLCNHVQG